MHLSFDEVVGVFIIANTLLQYRWYITTKEH